MEYAMTPTLRLLPLVTRTVMIAIVCLGVPRDAAANEEVPVSGKIFLVPKSTNAYVTLSGRGALELYNAMPTKARADACREGRKIKWSGDLYCSLAKDGKSADCNFGLNHKTGKISPGQPC
jgi:hypothetical protein